MQDIEFTVERGKLWMLQTRSGKRTAEGRAEDRGRHGRRRADRPEGGGIPRRPDGAGPAAAPRRWIPRWRRATCWVSGLPASPGAASGASRSTPRTAERKRGRGDAVIVVRVRRPPRRKIFTACMRRKGILTARGGMTSHAAVVARGMGRPCVSGAGMSRSIDAKAQSAEDRRGRELNARGRCHHHRRHHGGDHGGRSAHHRQPEWSAISAR